MGTPLQTGGRAGSLVRRRLRVLSAGPVSGKGCMRPLRSFCLTDPAERLPISMGESRAVLSLASEFFGDRWLEAAALLALGATVVSVGLSGRAGRLLTPRSCAVTPSPGKCGFL